MTKNKSVDLGIDTFMQSVAENKPAGNSGLTQQLNLS